MMRRRAASLALAAALSAAACSGDATGPGILVSVRVTGTHGPIITDDTPGENRIECSFDLEAAAIGPGHATWHDALVRFALLGQPEPFDSSVINAAEIRSSWGGDSITAGAKQQSQWSVWASIPFTAVIEFRYRPYGGSTTSTAVELSCGPAVPDAAPPPDVTTFTVRPRTAPLEPGDTLIVDLAVHSSFGLWRTGIALLGPCTQEQWFSERLQRDTTHVVRFVIGPACQLGVPISIGLFVVDAALQHTERMLDTPLMLEDVSPPQIVPMFHQRSGSSNTQGFSGNWYQGDTLRWTFNATDNRALRYLHWRVEPFGFRDSLLASGPAASLDARLILDSAWTGPMQLRLFARDVGGLVSDTIAVAVDVKPSHQNPVRTAIVPGWNWDALFNPDGSALYLRDPNGGSVRELSTTTMSVTRTFSLGGFPTDFDRTPSGDSLIAAVPSLGKLVVMDLTQPGNTTTLLNVPSPDSVSRPPGGIRMAANGKALITVANPGGALLVELDLGTGVRQLRTDAGVAGNVGGGDMARSYDHQVVVFNGGGQLFQRYDATTNSFGPRRDPRTYARPVVDGTGTRVAIGYQLYDANLQFERAVGPISIPPVALSPDGLYLYVALWNEGVIRYRTSDGQVVDRIPTNLLTTMLRISDDGKTLAIIESGQSQPTRIALVDLTAIP